MDGLNLIPCESIDALATRLNEEITEGNAISFHNNGGIFVKNPKDDSLVDEYLRTEICLPEIHLRGVAPTFRRSISSEKDFFRPGEIGDLFDYSILEKSNTDPKEPILIYGLRGLSPKSIEERHWNMDHLDSPDYGPASGIFTPTVIDKYTIFNFSPKDRIFYAKH